MFSNDHEKQWRTLLNVTEQVDIWIVDDDIEEDRPCPSTDPRMLLQFLQSVKSCIRTINTMLDRSARHRNLLYFRVSN